MLALHGAMVVEDVDDVEGELLAGAREIVGSTCPIVLTIDLHASLSERAFHIADVIVGYDTYPHVDIFAQGCEAAEILNRLIRGMKVRGSFRKLPLWQFLKHRVRPMNQCDRFMSGSRTGISFPRR